MKHDKDIIELLEQILETLRDIKDDTNSIESFISKLEVVRMSEEEGES